MIGALNYFSTLAKNIHIVLFTDIFKALQRKSLS